MTSPRDIEQAIARVTDQKSFLRELLAGPLEWPIPERIDDIGELAFGWTADDLRTQGLDEKLLDGQVWQLNLHAHQPWGVFLVEFGKEKLYRTVLRKVLRGLVPSRRRDGTLPAWKHENLLFLCATKDYQHLTFAHFRGDKPQTARLATFGWNKGDRHIRTVCTENLPHLEWPADRDPAAWLAKWAEAFDVEAVTKRFFNEYREVFEAVEKAVKGVPAGEPRRLYVQRLFNRLMFLYFIQRKGWLSFRGDKNYLRALFDAAAAAEEDFLNDRLYWTFFEGLNTFSEDPRRHKDPKLVEVRGEVPFLNGGLFDLEDDYDKQGVVHIPNKALGNVLDLFERFNFTVTESTPLDVEVAVDPEMLGKVFEELVTGRHESGSYYTPRPIVSFMCREALKHYLAPVGDAAPVARFVDEGNPDKLPDPEKALNALRAVKVCDPACGSGAYLLGMMHELLRLREALFAHQGLDKKVVYDRKLEIIQNNLYGVDLDPFAINIAKLRLWLSLAVDFEGTSPPPLPNLDFKIEQGDSLTAPDPQGIPDLFRQLLVERADQLAELKAAFLKNYGAKKKALGKEIKQAEAKLRDSLTEQSPDGSLDWRVAFAEVFRNGGFDIVLANPPYISALEFARTYSASLRSHLNQLYQSARGAYDIYVLFFERAAQCLVPGGVFCFINPNKYLSASYARALREFLLNECSLLGVVDISGIPVFENVAVYPILSLFMKRPRSASLVWLLHPRVRCLPSFDLAEYHLSTVSSDLLTLLPENIWGFLLSTQVSLLSRLLQGSSSLQDIGDVNATTTADEADEYGSYLSEKPTKSYFKVVNTGTIDPFQSLWGIERMTHAKQRYLTPYLDARKISKNRKALYQSPKVLFAKLAKACEAFLDDRGVYAGLNINCFHSPKKGVSLEYVCAFCNSSVFMFLYEQFFGALRMRGGYFQFQAPQLRVIPIRVPSPADLRGIVTLARQIGTLEESDRQEEAEKLRTQLDDLILAQYGLLAHEVDVIRKRRRPGVGAE